MFNKIFKKDDSYEFKPLLTEIEESPASPLGLFTFWVIVILMVCTIAWLFIGKIDVVVSARGIIIPDGDVKIIQPLDTGVIRKILVNPGDHVKKGQTLMEIDPSTTEPALESAEENLSNIKLEMKRLKAAAQGGSFRRGPNKYNTDAYITQQSLYRSSLSNLQKQIAIKKTQLNQINAEIKSTMAEKNNYSSLLKTAENKEQRLKNVLDVIAKDEYYKVVDDINTYRSNMDRANFKLIGLDHQKAQVNEEILQIRENFRTENLKELADREKQAVQLQSEAEQIEFRKQKQKITSPVDGYVDSLLIHTVGGVVTPAQKLISITPDNSPLLIKALVLNKDIGFVKNDMPAQIKIDTFSFQKYGMLDGKVKHISKSSIQDEKLGPVYEVYITPVTRSLLVEGKRESISSGMSLSAEIKIGKRRIIEFFIYPLIKYWNQGISVR